MLLPVPLNILSKDALVLKGKSSKSSWPTRACRVLPMPPPLHPTLPNSLLLTLLKFRAKTGLFFLSFFNLIFPSFFLCQGLCICRFSAWNTAAPHFSLGWLPSCLTLNVASSKKPSRSPQSKSGSPFHSLSPALFHDCNYLYNFMFNVCTHPPNRWQSLWGQGPCFSGMSPGKQ